MTPPPKKRRAPSNCSVTSETNNGEAASAKLREELIKANKEIEEKKALIEKQNRKLVAFEKTIVEMAKKSVKQPTKKEEAADDLLKTIGILFLGNFGLLIVTVGIFQAELFNKESGDWRDFAGSIAATIGFLAKELEEENITRKKEAETSKKRLADLTKKAVECCICKNEKANVLLRPCMHVAMCRSCDEEFSKYAQAGSGEKCPICRRAISGRWKVLL